MAIGTVTPVPVDPHSQGTAAQQSPVAIGDICMTVTNVVGAASYTVGGDTITPTQLGLSQVFAAQAELLTAPTSGTTNNGASGATLVVTNGGSTLNLKCFTNGSGAASVNSIECAATANLSNLTWQIIAFGLK